MTIHAGEPSAPFDLGGGAVLQRRTTRSWRAHRRRLKHVGDSYELGDWRTTCATGESARVCPLETSTPAPPSRSPLIDRVLRQLRSASRSIRQSADERYPSARVRELPATFNWTLATWNVHTQCREESFYQFDQRLAMINTVIKPATPRCARFRARVTPPDRRAPAQVVVPRRRAREPGRGRNRRRRHFDVGLQFRLRARRTHDYRPLASSRERLGRRESEGAKPDRPRRSLRVHPEMWVASREVRRLFWDDAQSAGDRREWRVVRRRGPRSDTRFRRDGRAGSARRASSCAS